MGDVDLDAQGNVSIGGDVTGRDKVTAGGDVVGRDKLSAGGHVIVAEAGATVIVNERETAAKPGALPQFISAQRPFEPKLVLIPAGEFLMGSASTKDKRACDNEKPQHKLHLPDYYIAKTPVTNAQYAVFVREAGHSGPNHWNGGNPPKGKEIHPVGGVTWHDAVAYCRWLAGVTGKPYGLPSEPEWEKAARGTDGRIYPWGNSWDAKRCNTSEGGKKDTTPVGVYPGGISPYGCLDMVGNVEEWTRSIFRGYPYDPDDGREELEGAALRVLRGSSWYTGAVYARCAYRFRDIPRYVRIHIGFRVVISPISLPFGL
ncbi:MAG: formylglycine-generating enzyme family protein [Anaerolineae bacterium]|nr:formylglycine-generating enzyme family protein [Anaerolineae bacterium]